MGTCDLLPAWWTLRQAHSGYPSFTFEVDRAEVPQGRVTPGRGVEAFDVVEHVGLGVRPRAVDSLSEPLGLSDEKKLSIAALS